MKDSRRHTSIVQLDEKRASIGRPKVEELSQMLQTRAAWR